MNEKVSVIIPIYNSQDTISRNLNSIINQTYKNIEILLINDGSTDGSEKILKEYEHRDKRIIVINQKNSGVSHTRNIGIDKATGKYILFVDSDDWIEPNMIEYMVMKIEEENVDIVRCNYFKNYDDGTQYKNENKENVNTKLSRKQIESLIIPRILNGDIPAYVWLLLIERRILDKVRKFDTSLAFMEDTIFYIDLLLNTNSMYILDIPLYHYYFNLSSATHSKNNYLRNLNNILKVNKLEEELLIEYNLFTKENQNLYNTTHAGFIESIFFKLFKNLDGNELKIVYKNILDNVKVLDILNKCDIKLFPKHIRISIDIIKSKNINKLIRYYRLRGIFAKLKAILKNK